MRCNLSVEPTIVDLCIRVQVTIVIMSKSKWFHVYQNKNFNCFLSERLQCLARKTTWSPLLPTLDFSFLAPLLFALRRKRLSSWIRGVRTIPLKIYLGNKVIFLSMWICYVNFTYSQKCIATMLTRTLINVKYFITCIQVNRSCRVSWIGCFKN